MSPSRPFIRGPARTSLLMLAIVLAGIVGFRFLPLSALPPRDYPTIQVQTLYPGGSPARMSRTAPRAAGAPPRYAPLAKKNSQSPGGALALVADLQRAAMRIQAATRAMAWY